MRDMFGNFAIKNRISVTKSHVYLFIFLCIIVVQTAYATPIKSTGQRLILHTSQHRQRYHQQLLQQQRTHIAPPTQHHRHHLHHRSVPNLPDDKMAGTKCNIQNSNDEIDFCDLNCILESARRQANATYNHIRNLFESYTFDQFQERNVTRFNEEWSLHNITIEHPYNGHLPELDAATDEQHFNSLLNDGRLTNDTLKTELLKAHNTLSLLQYAFKALIEARERNQNDVLRDVGNDQERYTKTKKFFEEVLKHIQRDLVENLDLMMQLNIEAPTETNKLDNFKRESAIFEWLLAKEHLLVMRYLTGLYEFLSSKCIQRA